MCKRLETDANYAKILFKRNAFEDAQEKELS